MKKIVVAAVSMVLMFGAGVCFAASDTPNLVGTWSVESEGITMLKGDGPAAGSMHGGEAAVLDKEGKIKHVLRKGKVVITAQKGRVLHGTFTSPKTTEDFIMVIGWDHKTIHMADRDGFMDGTIVNKNKINFIYRHVSPEDAVVTAAAWTRSK